MKKRLGRTRHLVSPPTRTTNVGKPLSQVRLISLILFIFAITCLNFWYYTHNIVTNYFKYLGYVAGFLLAVSKEVIKKDEATKQWQVQPLNHWWLPFLGLTILCLCSVAGEFKDAHDKKNAAGLEAMQHRVEAAKHKAEVENLLRQVAEQKTLLVTYEEKIDSRSREQHVEAERTRAEQRMFSKQNAFEQKFQSSQTQLVEKEQAAETRREQHAEATRLEVAQATQSVHNLVRALNPIQNIAVSYRVEIPLDEPSMTKYRADLNQS